MNRFETLIEKVEVYFCHVDVSFNSQKYSLNVLKPYFKRVLADAVDDDIRFFVKKTQQMTCIETNKFYFLGKCNLITPGFS